MSSYKKTDASLWAGRKSEQDAYLHEKVELIDLDKDEFSGSFEKRIGLLGYSCDEGVRRNQGRTGAVEGPNAIKKQLAKMPNHLDAATQLIDAGSIFCEAGDMENAQERLAQKVAALCNKQVFPIVLGGGHDIAYGHYKGLKKYVGNKHSIGIINFDAHFDLRSNENGNNSGTPFYQIAQESIQANEAFNYLCLGIRKDANNSQLFQTATEFGVEYIANDTFTLHHIEEVQSKIMEFISNLDQVYLTIDLDGFSSAYAPGVSAASPMGFSPDVVLSTLQVLLESKKLIGVDLAEMNPKYDRDNQTAKLAASLLFSIIHGL